MSRYLAAIGAEPAGNRIYVDTEAAEYFLRHDLSPLTL
jgi:hypothetical protein